VHETEQIACYWCVDETEQIACCDRDGVSAESSQSTANAWVHTAGIQRAEAGEAPLEAGA